MLFSLPAALDPMAAPRLDRGPDQVLHLIATTFYCVDCKMIVKGEVAVPCMSCCLLCTVHSLKQQACTTPAVHLDIRGNRARCAAGALGRL